MTDPTAATAKSDPETNPWYLLATLYGEPSSSDEELRDKNRVAWNRYVISLIDEVRASYLLSMGRCSPNEVKPLSTEELEDFNTAFLERADGKFSLSNLDQTAMKFYNMEFGEFFVSKYIFPLPCDFRKTVFREADFRNATFCERVDFEGSKFLYEADFENVEFHDFASFEEVEFPDMPVNFDHSIFSSWAIFERSTFPSIGGFIDVTFAHHADFMGATFSDTAWFKGSVFSSEANFTNVSISGPADFEGARFFGEALFWRAKFSGWAAFENVTFSDEASFESSTFERSVSFEAATFEASAYFVNAEMRGPTAFRNTRFCSEPPKFFGAKMHEGTVWQHASWPPSPTNAIEAGAFVQAYERLKLEMDRLKKHEDELYFFAHELQCRRILYGDWKPIRQIKLFGGSVELPSFTMKSWTFCLYSPAPGILIGLYGLLCGYGRSYVRPLWGLPITVAIGIPLFWLRFSLRQAVSLSLANTFGVLGFRKDFIEPKMIEALPGILEIVSGLQTIAGSILLFLLGLSIRNRLRMK